MNESLVKKIELYISDRLENELPKGFVYHNLKHTQSVVKECEKLGLAMGVSAEELLIVKTSAWFHDIGYISSYESHEEESAKVARDFLEKENCEEDLILQVEKCIRATKVPQLPATICEKIICDADLAKAAKKSFLKNSMLLYQEWKNLDLFQETTELGWLIGTLDFLNGHHYHTSFAKEKWNKEKLKNIQKLEKRINQLKDKEKKTKFGRGVETMFRTSSRNHIQLSAIADNKANIMLSINAIIISVVISVLLPTLSSKSELIMPTILLLCVCITSVVFATISTIPKVTEGTFTREDIANKTANLMFFSNFHSVPLKDFQWGVQEMMYDEEFLYASMTKDLYFLGIVLHKKYKYLRICYAVFMFGMILTVGAFIVCFLIQPPATNTVYP